MKTLSAYDQSARIDFMGVPVDAVTLEQAVNCCLKWIRQDRKPRLVLTADVNVLVQFESNAQLRRVVEAAALVVADGMPIVRLSGLLARALPERVTGIDLMARLLEVGSRERLRVFFLGAREHVVRALAQKTSQLHPGLQVAGYRNGYFCEEQCPEIIQQVRASSPDILFVGLPAPMRELWSYAHLEALGAPVVLGVGGSFDVLAGFIRRAPHWMQRSSLEWLWRILMEPRKRWKRYLACNTVFLRLVIRELLRRGWRLCSYPRN